MRVKKSFYSLLLFIFYYNLPYTLQQGKNARRVMLRPVEHSSNGEARAGGAGDPRRLPR